MLFRLDNWMVWLISGKSETTVVRAQYVGNTYVWSTKVISRFFNSFPVDLAVNACNSPTSRHTPITSKINQRRKWNSISKLTNAWRKCVINQCVIIRICLFIIFNRFLIEVYNYTYESHVWLTCMSVMGTNQFLHTIRPAMCYFDWLWNWTFWTHPQQHLVPFQQSMRWAQNHTWQWAHLVRLQCTLESSCRWRVSFRNHSEYLSTVCWPASIDLSKWSKLCRPVKNVNFNSINCQQTSEKFRFICPFKVNLTSIIS